MQHHIMTPGGGIPVSTHESLLVREKEFVLTFVYKVYALLNAASKLRLEDFKSLGLQLIQIAQWEVFLHSHPLPT